MGINRFKIVSTDIQSPDSDSIEIESAESGDSNAAEEKSKAKTKKDEEDTKERKGEKNDEFKMKEVVSLDKLVLNKEDNIILVLGSEGEGVSRTINRLADYRVMIPP